MFRPQYAYPPTPRGKEDETYHYSFDNTNTPYLALSLASLQYFNDIILPMDQDTPFICRGIKIQLSGAAESRSGFPITTLDVKLKTPHGDYLQTNFVPISRWATGSGIAVAGQLMVPMENEIECPAGSNWTMYLYNPTSGSVTPPAVTLFGVKRRGCKKVAA